MSCFTIHPSRESHALPGGKSQPAGVRVDPVDDGLMVTVHLRGPADSAFDRHLDQAVEVVRKELVRPDSDMWSKAGCGLTGLQVMEQQAIGRRPELLSKLAELLEMLVLDDRLQDTMLDRWKRTEAEVSTLEKAKKLNRAAAARN